MKTFLSFVPRQPKGALKETVYEPADNPALVYGKTHFPIIPVINAYAQQGETISMLLVVEEYENCRNNAEIFREEFYGLCEKKGILCPEITVISIPYDDSVETQISAFQKLTEHIEDDADLYACITYGSKPSPIVELMALRYARQLKQDTYIACVVYGQFDHNLGKAMLYDVTALARLDDVMRVLIDTKMPDPQKMLSRILNQ